jgi:fibronectin type 3 domain-containing protein
LSVNTSTNTITTLVSGAPLTYPTDIAMSGFIPAPQPATNVTPVVKSSIPPSVTLNWTASTSAVTGYNVYRNRNSGGFTKIASVPASSMSYTDTGVAFGDSLDYYVTSVDSSNVESVPSNVVHTGLA